VKQEHINRLLVGIILAQTATHLAHGVQIYFQASWLVCLLALPIAAGLAVFVGWQRAVYVGFGLVVGGLLSAFLSASPYLWVLAGVLLGAVVTWLADPGQRSRRSVIGWAGMLAACVAVVWLVGRLDAAGDFFHAVRWRSYALELFVPLVVLIAALGWGRAKTDEASREFTIFPWAVAAAICLLGGQVFAYQGISRIENGRALFDAGRRYFMQGDLGQAETCLQQALEIAPKDSAVHFALSRTYQAAGKQDQAETHLKQVETLDPKGALSYYMKIATQYQRMRQFKRASACYERALRLRDDKPEVYLGLGAAYFKQSRYDEALVVFEKVLTLDDQNLNAHESLAVLYAVTGEYVLAISQLEQCIALDPSHPSRRAWEMGLKQYQRKLGYLR